MAHSTHMQTHLFNTNVGELHCEREKTVERFVYRKINEHRIDNRARRRRAENRELDDPRGGKRSTNSVAVDERRDTECQWIGGWSCAEGGVRRGERRVAEPQRNGVRASNTKPERQKKNICAHPRSERDN